MKPDPVSKVLIVGAGPTGLFTAITLARMGVSVSVIEKRADPGSDSKALSLSPLSAQLLQDSGALSPILRNALATRAFNVRYGDSRICRIDFDRLRIAHPYFLMQPQPATESMLEERLRELGGCVLRGTELEKLEQDEMEVAVTLRSKRHGAMRSRFSYVIGCDGARSRVREEIGASFTGFDYSGMHFILTDCEVEWDGALDEAHYFVTDDGFMVLAPLTDRLHRVVIQVKKPFDAGFKPPFEQFLELAAKIAPRGFRMRNPIWISSAPFYNRLASTNRAGRVFLAGDAAHLFSPIGGMGMNTGLGDAFNLGWKLGYVLTGLAHESLLETYRHERLSLAAQLVAQTDHSTSLVARLDRHSFEDDRKFLPLFENRDFMRRVLPTQASGLGQAYPNLSSGTDARTGTMILRKPKEPFRCRIGHTIVIGAGSESRLEAIRSAKRLNDEFGNFVDARVEISDADSLIRDGEYALVRPDSYIERIDQDESELASYLRQTYPC